MKTHQFKFSDQTASFEAYLDLYLKNKSTDCILYSKDGSKLRVHKELFGQTDFLREILSSTKEHFCSTIEVLIPCSKVELKHLVNFLYDGEIHCENESDSLKVIENLQKIFGFPGNLDLSYPNQTFFTSVNNIEAMTITEEVFEDILDDPNAEKVVIIPLRSKNESSKLVVIDQGKEDNVLDNGEKKVSKKKKKSKKNSRTKVKGSSMKKYENKFNCNDCGASFIYKSQLQMHINAVHLKLKPYECDLCEMSFARKSDLKGHVKVIHQQIRPFECDQCKKTFSQKFCLKSHMQSSNCKKLKETCYKCKDCVAVFEKKDYLKHHVNRIHLKMKPLKKLICNECEASFEIKQSLEHHMNKVHLNFKPYECNLCKKAFFIEALLKRHLRAFHKEEAK